MAETTQALYRIHGGVEFGWFAVLNLKEEANLRVLEEKDK
jgi:hypothetical protein